MADVKVPELAESIAEAAVAEWLVKPGDSVSQDQIIATIETDKVVLEVFAPTDGVIGEIKKAVGEEVASGELLTTVSEGTAPAAAAAPEPAPVAAPAAAAEASAPAGAASDGATHATETIEIKVPELAESIAEASLSEWLKQPGDAVAVDEVIATIETDKVVLEVPAPKAGKLTEQAVEAGADVGSGQLIARIAVGAAPSATKATPAAAPAVVQAPSATKDTSDAAPAAVQAPSADAHAEAFPAARKMAAELDVDLGAVAGSGKGGRVTKADVASAVAEPSAKPAAVQSGARSERREKMTKLRTAIANRLLESQRTTAMLTTFNEVDMSAVISTRKKYRDAFAEKHGIKLGIMSFFVKAVCAGLKQFPIVNAAIDGNEIVYHDYCDVGIAVGSARGLVVPVLRSAEMMSMAEIESSIADFGARAQSGKLEMDELSGGTFTITNGGVFGSLLSTPIINPPQSAILGVHGTNERPVVVDGEIAVRPMNYLALSYDHQIIDGRDAVLFLVAVKQALEDPARLLLEV